MSEKRFLFQKKVFIRFLSLTLAVLLLGLFPALAYGEEPKDETTGTEEEKPVIPQEDGLPTTPSVTESAPALFADSAQDVNYILVEKTFVGLLADQIPDAFQVVVSSDGNTYTLNGENTVSQETNTDGDTVWRWKITDAGTGTYTVKETGETVCSYTVRKSGEGTVEVKAAAMTVLVPVHETTCSHNNWPVKVEGDSHVLFAATLTQGGVAVISRFPLSASQRAAVSQAVLMTKGPWKNPVYFYSIEEQFQSGNGFELNGATILYHAEKEEVVIGRTKNWQHVATLTYSMAEGSDPEIALRNVYTRSTAALTVQKAVEGDLGDREKKFSFTVSVRENGANADFVLNGAAASGSADFSLKHGESALLEKIPVGAEVTVTEGDYAKENYRVSYTRDQKEPVSGREVTIPAITEGEHTLLFTNRKDAIPDTGIRLDTVPYLLLIGMAACSALLLFSRRKGRLDR